MASAWRSSVSGHVTSSVIFTLVLLNFVCNALSLNDEEKNAVISSHSSNEGLLSFFQSAMEVKSRTPERLAMVTKETRDDSDGMASNVACGAAPLKSFGQVDCGLVNELHEAGGPTGDEKHEHVPEGETELPVDAQEAVTSVLRVLLRFGIFVIIADALFRWRNSEKDALCRPASVGRLLQKGTQVNSRNSDGETQLHCAARAGSVQDCELLLAYGAQVNALNNEEKTPLVIAAETRREDVCTFLMGHGANVGNLSEVDIGSLPFFFQMALEEQKARRQMHREAALGMTLRKAASEAFTLQKDDSGSDDDAGDEDDHHLED